MIKVEVLWEALDRPSDNGILNTRVFNKEAGKTVEYYATRIYGFGVPRIVASLEHFDNPGWSPLALDDELHYSSRLVLRARVPEADTRLIFMYAEAGIPFSGVGGLAFGHKSAGALLELDPYDCAMVLAKKFLSKDSRGDKGVESMQEAARRLLKSKPLFKDLKGFAASAYSTKLPSDKNLLREFYESGKSRIIINTSAKVSEIIEPLRGRRRCHMIFLQRVRSAAEPAGDSRAAKPPPLSKKIVTSAIKAVIRSDASLFEAAEDGTLTAKMVRMAVAAHLKETDGGARLKSKYESYFTIAVTSLNDTLPRHLAKQASPPEPDEPAATPAPPPELLTGAAGLLQILDEFKIKNGGVDDPYYSAMRGALEELEIEERDNPPRPL